MLGNTADVPIDIQREHIGSNSARLARMWVGIMKLW